MLTQLHEVVQNSCQDEMKVPQSCRTLSVTRWIWCCWNSVAQTVLRRRKVACEANVVVCFNHRESVVMPKRREFKLRLKAPKVVWSSSISVWASTSLYLKRLSCTNSTKLNNSVFKNLELSKSYPLNLDVPISPKKYNYHFIKSIVTFHMDLKIYYLIIAHVHKLGKQRKATRGNRPPVGCSNIP